MRIEVRRKLKLLYPWFILLVGLCLTGFVGYRTKMDIELYERQIFTSRCDEIVLKAQARLAAHKEVLLSGAAMFDASDNVSRDEWKMYVQRLRLDQHFNGIQALGFALWIKPEKLAAHENSLRKEGFADYHVKPEGKRDAYTSIIYIEPFAGRNLRAFGYDMYSEAVRHAAMSYAVDNNTVALSGKVTLVQETTTDIQAGTLMYTPVYQKNTLIDTIEQRRAAIFGWVYSPFRMKDLLQYIVSIDDKNKASYLHLQVYDGDKIVAENLLYQSDENATTAPLLFSLETKIELYGTVWTFHFEQRQNIGESGIDFSKVWFTLGSGTLISFLIFFLIRAHIMMQANAHVMAQNLTAQLRESERRFRLLADSAPVLIWTAKTDKLCDYFNKVWLDFTHRTLEQLQGNGWAEDVHVEDFQRCLETYVDAFDERQSFQMEYRLRRYDGEYRWILDTGVPRFVDDKFVGYIGSCIDITELKISERKLTVINADLMQFTHVAAHHLQEPARRIVSYVQRLKNTLTNLPACNDDDVMISLQFIEQSAIRQRALVSDIQLYLAATQPRAAIESVSVVDVLTKVVEKSAPLIQETHAHIEYGELPAVMIDRMRLYDIFNILLENALHYRRLDCPPKIRIYGEEYGQRIRYYVEDNGIGIPAEYRERVFLVFERLQVNDDQASTGIGLAIVRRIVESCDGSVHLEETAGGGTTVIFDLPSSRSF